MTFYLRLSHRHRSVGCFPLARSVTERVRSGVIKSTRPVFISIHKKRTPEKSALHRQCSGELTELFIAVCTGIDHLMSLFIGDGERLHMQVRIRDKCQVPLELFLHLDESLFVLAAQTIQHSGVDRDFH